MREFQVGDVCRIREWDDMAAEFGTMEGQIGTYYFFVPSMRFLCGGAIHDI